MRAWKLFDPCGKASRFQKNPASATRALFLPGTDRTMQKSRPARPLTMRTAKGKTGAEDGVLVEFLQKLSPEQQGHLLSLLQDILKGSLRCQLPGKERRSPCCPKLPARSMRQSFDQLRSCQLCRRSPSRFGCASLCHSFRYATLHGSAFDQVSRGGASFTVSYTCCPQKRMGSALVRR